MGANDPDRKTQVKRQLDAFGVGFGSSPKDQMRLRIASSPKTGSLFQPEQCSAVGAWVDNPSDMRPLTQLIAPEALQDALYNQLIHADIIELVRLLPKVLAK